MPGKRSILAFIHFVLMIPHICVPLFRFTVAGEFCPSSSSECVSFLFRPLSVEYMEIGHKKLDQNLDGRTGNACFGFLFRYICHPRPVTGGSRPKAGNFWSFLEQIGNFLVTAQLCGNFLVTFRTFLVTFGNFPVLFW
jgi:hypothetical protein